MAVPITSLSGVPFLPGIPTPSSVNIYAAPVFAAESVALLPLAFVNTAILQVTGGSGVATSSTYPFPFPPVGYI